MAVYEKFMENYETKKDGDGNVISHTTVAAEDCRKKIVWVTHDESCAKANDSNNHAYLFHQDATDGSKESKPPMSKNEGASYMVSGFVCPCHGFMQVTQEQVDHYNQQIDQLPSCRRWGWSATALHRRCSSAGGLRQRRPPSGGLDMDQARREPGRLLEE
jgi:hypothetical protein